ncbi:pseudouridylate synthase, putative [Plasmodium knowlesi strain H]|uniref:Pseudouridylate synthase, putative n=3 Tax=Plasmodium knowlesi TaxID=5850 RepID=A0A5K1UU85_PLAKH|nr:pseudouridylate synthase, putative [Plasmodium knowlesi strain H]OTN67319.1 putative Pseudouridylate synthase [Plasmodium knowlesi]CAA9987410.1 pseudouridylate synthase, putative [Plasmodium knowlesi strain H]SBO23289.1 pseudouridylate synthase, putative [Plasmodium knowlesi strain H]SBO24326.1 pseudouridylate synthase, putative [Plasmodium knowlesi strain H]VVS76884.1 pseudouridylate synthase, putative [Plasmodium knowlesi strain H]|eukprot:XP_002258411.1 pseudouridylate synthase, putative [Plasmodium knowlesi strain H]
MLLYGLLPLILITLAYSFKVMRIVIPNTSGLNVVDSNFEPKYFTKNKLRFVSPYVYTYKLYTKKRWIGKRISDVLTSEFCAYDLSYIKESIRKGYIKVNKENVSCDYLLKSNDLIQHKLLLFEKPVICNKILILYEDQNFICVYKSASMPTHPVGFYQYNSLLRILQNYISSTLRKEQLSGEENIGQTNPKDEQTERNEGDVIKISFNYKEATIKDNPGVESPSPQNEEPQQGKEQNGDNGIDLGERQIEGHADDVVENAKKRKQEKIFLDDNKCLNKSGENRKKVATNLRAENINGDDYLTNERDLNETIYTLNNVRSVPPCSIESSEEGKKQNEEKANTDKSAKPPVEPISENVQRRVKQHKSYNNERKDKQEKDDSYIYTLHRLDKLTSGIVMFGKNKNFSTFFSQNISNNSIKKSYITRVEGDFRILIRTLLDEKKVIDDMDNKTLNELVEDYCSVGKDDSPLPLNGGNSFKNDIFLHRNSYCEEGALSGQGDMDTLSSIIREKRNYLLDEFDVEKFELGCEQRGNDGDVSGGHGHCNRSGEEDNPLRQHFVVDFGYMYCENKKLLKYVFTKYSEKNRQIAEEYCLKPSITRFMFLAYNPELNESLVLCQPITGRTHQIRAHLKSLSFPISNDPQYNDNFAKEYMDKSVYLHFHEGDQSQEGTALSQDTNGTASDTHDELTSAPIAKTNSEKEDNLEKYTHFPLIPFVNTSFHWLYDEKIDLNDTYNEADLNNYFFKKISNITYHSSGIFLHSFRYTWENVFDVFTLLPKWCSLFHLPKGLLTFLLYGSLS